MGKGAETTMPSMCLGVPLGYILFGITCMVQPSIELNIEDELMIRMFGKLIEQNEQANARQQKMLEILGHLIDDVKIIKNKQNHFEKILGGMNLKLNEISGDFVDLNSEQNELKKAIESHQTVIKASQDDIKNRQIENKVTQQMMKDTVSEIKTKQYHIWEITEDIKEVTQNTASWKDPNLKLDTINDVVKQINQKTTNMAAPIGKIGDIDINVKNIEKKTEACVGSNSTLITIETTLNGIQTFIRKSDVAHHGKWWHERQCAYLDRRQTVKSLEECRTKCYSHNSCNAFEYDVHSSLDCYLRACSIPVPVPTENKESITGYVINKDTNIKWHTAGLTDIFVISNEHMSWPEGRALCKSYSLDLYMPLDSFAVAAYLNTYSDDKRSYWIGGRGNGQDQVWITGGMVPKSGPWYSNFNHANVASHRCLAMRTNDVAINDVKVLAVANCRDAIFGVLCG